MSRSMRRCTCILQTRHGKRQHERRGRVPLSANLTASDVAHRLALTGYPRSWRGHCPACNYATTFAVRAHRPPHPGVREGLAAAITRLSEMRAERLGRPPSDNELGAWLAIDVAHVRRARSQSGDAR
jgi:hypothetical protein